MRAVNIAARACVASACLASTWSGAALAHGGGVPVTPDDLWTRWTIDPWVLVPLILVHWLYGRGLLRLWARAGRGRGVGYWRVLSFLAGEAMLVLALVSPLDQLGETLLFAHMIQHGILVAVAPPLLLYGLPGAVLPWALPQEARRSLGRATPLRAAARSLAWTVRPLPATALHGVALWAWHAPAAFEAALLNETLHTLEHVSFFGTAILFWHALNRAAGGVGTAGAGLAAALITTIHGGFLGALITFSPNVLYPWYDGRAQLWGLAPLADQQLAGILMWLPIGMTYLAAGLLIAARLIGPDEDEAAPQVGPPAERSGERARTRASAASTPVR